MLQTQPSRNCGWCFRWPWERPLPIATSVHRQFCDNNDWCFQCKGGRLRPRELTTSWHSDDHWQSSFNGCWECAIQGSRGQPCGSTRCRCTAMPEFLACAGDCWSSMLRFLVSLPEKVLSLLINCVCGLLCLSLTAKRLIG